MNYRERAQKIANNYRLSVCNNNPLDLVSMIAEELKLIAREARKQTRKQERNKFESTDA